VHDGARTVIVLVVHNDSPLAEGRMPIDAVRDENGIRAKFDAVSYGALRASVGEFMPVEDVIQMFVEVSKQTKAETSQNSKSEVNGP
jgi:hypothetical protein